MRQVSLQYIASEAMSETAVSRRFDSIPYSTQILILNETLQQLLNRPTRVLAFTDST